MQFPGNISNEDLLKAIEKIDKEGIPNDAESQYYDVVYAGKHYPPKVVVSFANIFANGYELDRNSFSGGLNTPCFKLLEQHGFTIEKKNKNMYYILKIEIDGTVIQKSVAANTYVDAFNLLYEKNLIDDSIADDFDFIKRAKTEFNRSEQEHDSMLFLIKGSKDLWISTYSSTERKHNLIKSVFNKYNINGTVEMIEVNGDAKNDNTNDIPMNRVKIYEVKTSASANSHELLSPDGKYFYWDDDQFKTNEVGDKIFFIEPTRRWALYTELKIPEISTTFNTQKLTSSFNHEYNTYTVPDANNEYKTFIRFDIIKRVPLPSDWKWTKTIGQSEVYDIWKPGTKMSNVEDRIKKIDDLELLFDEGEAFEILEEARENLSQENTLKQEIVDAINSPQIQSIIEEDAFDLQYAIDSWLEVKNYQEPTQGFLQNVLAEFKASNQGFTSYINSLDKDNEVYRVLSLLANLYSYCDTNAAGKAERNEYTDKRVIAKTNIPQNEWIDYLLKFKINNNDDSVLSQSISYIISYLDDPLTEIPMVSIHHRQMLAKYLLRKPYEPGSFVQDVIQYFRPYNINPRNPLNLTRIIGSLLYRFPKVKKLWFERIGGLAVLDSTEWKDNAIKGLKNKKSIVLWWHRAPSRRAKVDKLLPETIKNEGFFYLYYIRGNRATYRARIREYSYGDNYKSKLWNKNDDVAWYSENFSDYKDDTGKSATIAFLADEFIKLTQPIPVDKFDFYESEPPRQVNLQPYSELNWDEEIASVSPAINRNVWFVCQGTSFTTEEAKQYLWAPTKDKNGNGKYFGDNVSLVKKGDIIFNYALGELRGVSIATSDGYSNKNPNTESEWTSEGLMVDIDYLAFSKGIKNSELRDNKEIFLHILGKEYSPFDTNGGIKQGYLFRFSKQAGRLVRDIYGQPFGKKEIDEFFDNVDVIEPLTKRNEMKPKEIIEHAHRYMLSKGFQYQVEEIANFYLALKAKPFVILAGISGTGKSQLPKQFAKAIGMEKEQVMLVPVRPDWTDGSDLLGYTGLDNKFKPKDLTIAIIEAQTNPEKPFFFILDEMNLARVEHYFSDFLSVIETREWEDEEKANIITDPMLRKEVLQTADNSKDFKELTWPKNLYLIGTVNMDETTHAFSRKVLDRANSIEMNEVNLG